MSFEILMQAKWGIIINLTAWSQIKAFKILQLFTKFLVKIIFNLKKRTCQIGFPPSWSKDPAIWLTKTILDLKMRIRILNNDLQLLHGPSPVPKGLHTETILPLLPANKRFWKISNLCFCLFSNFLLNFHNSRFYWYWKICLRPYFVHSPFLYWVARDKFSKFLKHLLMGLTVL